MLKSKRAITLLSIAFGFSLVVILVQQDVTILFAKNTANESLRKPGQPVATKPKALNPNTPLGTLDENECSCNASNNGQYCGPGGYGCEVPPTPMNDQGCGQKTGGSVCDEGSCCTKIFT